MAIRRVLQSFMNPLFAANNNHHCNVNHWEFDTYSTHVLCSQAYNSRYTNSKVNAMTKFKKKNRWIFSCSCCFENIFLSNYYERIQNELFFHHTMWCCISSLFPNIFFVAGSTCRCNCVYCICLPMNLIQSNRTTNIESHTNSHFVF